MPAGFPQLDSDGGPMRLWGVRSLQISEQNLLPDDDAATLEDVGIVGGAYTVCVCVRATT